MKRVFVLLLALIMVTSSFVACSSKTDETEQSDKSSETTAPQSETATESETDSIGNLDPSINLNENEITILSRSHSWFKNEVSVENTTGDPIEDSIFQRNLDVENRLNCKLVNVKANESDFKDFAVVKTLENTLGPDCPYQIMATSAFTAFGNTTTGICQDLLGVDNLNLDADYWLPHFNKEATIGNRQYFATGSISLSLRRFIFVTFFNTRLADQYQVENLYDVVKEKRWTLDYQAQVIKNMYVDNDGIEGATIGDFYGLVTNNHICVDPYWTAGDAKVLVKDENDLLVLAPEIEKLDKILAKVKDIYYGGATYVFPGESGDVDQDKIRAKFTNCESTMATLRLLEVEAEDFRNMSDKYGILPIPKYDEKQEEYYSHAHDQFCVYGIVSSVPSTQVDDIGAVLECMAIEGQRTVTPAYFEMALKGKYAKDPESWDMLDLIVKNIKINGGLLYTPKLNNFVQNLRTVVRSQSSSFATTVFHPLMNQALNKRLKIFIKEVEQMQS